MDAFKKGWFTEEDKSGKLWPGQAFSLEVEEVYETVKSKYQDVIFFKSKNYGNVLVLDGVIQITERDQASYQEMICHTPILAHKAPENVLIVGGGDGGVMFNALMHKDVKKVTLCEIDEVVLEKCKKYFPAFASAWQDKRIEVCCRDGFEFLKERAGEYDVIICDSSDPEGPAEALFTRKFYELMKGALRPGGIVCTQAECIWLHAKIIKQLVDDCRTLFKNVEYSYITIPTYPSGTIGFVICSDDAEPRKPQRTPVEAMGAETAAKLQYYSPDVHAASFVLPAFAQKALLAADDKKE